MTYEKWLSKVPEEFKKDTIWNSEVYRLAVFAIDLAWHDTSKLMKDRRTFGVADQLNRAVGSISANFAEGYSRQSRRDQARFYEYSLGSAREARNWYYQARHLLGDVVGVHRMRLMTQIIRLLLTIIPAERGYRLEEQEAMYHFTFGELVAIPGLEDASESPVTPSEHATRYT